MSEIKRVKKILNSLCVISVSSSMYHHEAQFGPGKKRKKKNQNFVFRFHSSQKVVGLSKAVVYAII